MSLSRDYFESIYSAADDPWSFASSPYALADCVNVSTVAEGYGPAAAPIMRDRTTRSRAPLGP